MATATDEAVLDSGPNSDLILATLRVRSGLPGRDRLPVRLPQVVIGSDPVSDVMVAAEGVARRHAQLRLRGGVWTYTDFGSPAGSAVDGDAVRGEAHLAPGSSLRIGSVELAFAPHDRWEDSPPERRGEDRSPVVLLPPDASPGWSALAVVLAVCGVFAATFFLLRNS